MNIRMYGDTLIRENVRPAEFVETKDAAGNVVSNVQVMPAIHMVAPNYAEPVSKGGIMPLILAAGAAYLMLKG